MRKFDSGHEWCWEDGRNVMYSRLIVGDINTLYSRYLRYVDYTEEQWVDGSIIWITFGEMVLVVWSWDGTRIQLW